MEMVQILGTRRERAAGLGCLCTQINWVSEGAAQDGQDHKAGQGCVAIY